jgi:DNA replication and repair protein RecF
MVLTDIHLQQYRSYSEASFELGKGVNIIVGPNAAGKTNLLESIMLNSTGKSYRTRGIGLIRNDHEWARIDVHTSKNTLRTVKIQTDPSGKPEKTFEIDDKVYTKLPLAHQQPVVLFEPNDLLLVEGEPQLRRDYFDNTLEQYTSGYEKLRQQYKRVVAQRNALLKQSKQSTNQMFAWNLRLVDLGDQLVKQRLELVDVYNMALTGTYSAIANHKKRVSLTYISSVDTANYGTSLLKKLEATIELDIQRGYTGSGPHRDDFSFSFDDRPALHSASRGEIRTLLLSLKILELGILEQEKHIRPLLLLDDVFSELDGSRRQALTAFIKDYQTIITTTDADAAIRSFESGYSVISL